ncbi:Histone-lysine n-methyltransferase [Thalictrum thalictroides]|uniref:Histone-lysine n-methyltransferase n=1 Tax=Thalictrum thalictroides TaxID=46969 RepID=A0A7J6X2R6_THATH|nr:Histone-lysine n-methyltransferase [Thalictrum thalictroides]
MAFTVSSKTNQPSSNSVDHEETETLNTITRHLYLKPTHTTESIDKDVILRRIRNRRRVNKVQSVLQAMFGSPSSEKAVDKVTMPSQMWLEDTFSAP